MKYSKRLETHPSLPHIISTGLIVLAVLGILGYGVARALPLLQGPRIHLTESEPDEQGVIVLSGTVKNTATLTLDGGEVLINTDRAFTETVPLPPGRTDLVFVATDKFGKETRYVRTFIQPHLALGDVYTELYGLPSEEETSSETTESLSEES
ncbi:MAG: hypothetical protein LRY41_00805 [Candidatus Pacebacteria bacterium]|nr:hypothetical protein [Candidatus Paceibacterota bacterium]MCD8507999.1 hypothetical protein [Candidatus Paceibacterota bacterium]MCD8527860.1 hypothetical protein [Candidatus Paceibacterota bacterium]MCD8564045.1 hypothetical protein [Candidatus Paceibacterota bacterium]